VTVDITGTESLMIEAEDNLLSRLTSEVKDGNWSWAPIAATREITYTVTATGLDGITIDGSGSVTVADIAGEELTTEINGSGAIDLTGLDLASLVATISGSGGIDASGTADNLRIEIPGSGAFTGSDLDAMGADVTISGSGAAVVSVSEVLTADISGSGTIEYLGNPTVDSTVSGSGSVRSR
jgi:hypothetical protein